MSTPEMPQFLTPPLDAWVRCDEIRTVGSEVLCSVKRIFGGNSIIITSSRFVDPEQRRVQGVVTASIPGDGRLVDFPSGDRVAVPKNSIELVNGGTV